MNKIFFSLIVLVLSDSAFAQYKTYDISIKGDTINAVKADGTKTGKWIIQVPELRGEPGYEEEGIFKDGVKEGYWRKYTLEGDCIAIENYFKGQKSGAQKYFTNMGDLLREEQWRAYNPEHPYDTVLLYGTGSNEIIGTKVVKADPYAVRHGEWKYYDPSTGRVTRVVKYELNREIAPPPANATTTDSTANASAKPKEIKKTAEMLEWEKKNRNKKKAMRDGAVSL